MALNTTHYPDIISVPRLTTLFVSLLVTLGSGTNYVYSAYAPQLGARLNISHTHLNIVGLAGNLGVYGSGPIWGRIVDTHGPRIPLVSAFVLLLVGYSSIKLIFDAGVPDNSNTISFLTSCILVLCSFMTGAGGNAGWTGAVNSTAKTFPDKTRATATGLVISGFGLSAFLFSTVSRICFPGNTSSFLGLLALGTSVPMVFGFFFVRPVPLRPASSSEEYLSSEETRVSRHHEAHDNEHEHEYDEEQSALLPLSSSATPSPSLSLSPSPSPPPPPIHGHALFKTSNFLLLFIILSILAGTGLTYINNVGLMSQALYLYSLNGGGGVTRDYDPIQAAHWQADQVSFISLLNFAGRIFIGLTTDTLKHTHALPRSTSLLLVSSLFFLSQLLASFVDNIKYLWVVSATLGLAHGSVFSLMPNVCLDWFGITHFSENWGYLSIAPIICGNIFGIVFGRILDAHDRNSSSSSPSSPPSFSESHTTSLALTPRTSALISSPVSTYPNTTHVSTPPPGACTLGRICYVDALYLTLSACLVGVALSAWAVWRDRHGRAEWRRGRGRCGR